MEPPFQNGCGYVLWETTLPVDTAVTLNITETVGTLDTAGKLLLWGQASSETARLDGSLAILADTEVVTEISGDVADTLSSMGDYS